MIIETTTLSNNMSKEVIGIIVSELRERKGRKNRFSNVFINTVAFRQNQPQHLGQMHPVYILVDQIQHFVDLLVHSHKNKLSTVANHGRLEKDGTSFILFLGGGQVLNWPAPE